MNPIENSSVSVFSPMSGGDDVFYINIVFNAFIDAQQKYYENFMNDREITFNDELSLNSIKEFRVEYVAGHENDIHFVVQINIPSSSSRFCKTSSFDNKDNLYVETLSFRFFCTPNNLTEIKEYNGYAMKYYICGSTTTRSSDFIDNIMDIIGQEYHHNRNTSRNKYIKQKPLV